MRVGLYLAAREVWRNRARFATFAGVIALITVLILFVAALGEGLGTGNREFLEKLEAQLLVYQDTARLSIPASILSRDILADLRNIEGVSDAGPISFTGVAVVDARGMRPMDVSLVGVEPGKPGEPPVLQGNGLARKSASEVIIDETLATMYDLTPGDTLTVRTPQGNQDAFYDLTVVGVTDSRKYAIRPTITVPFVTFERLHPGADPSAPINATTFNIAALQLADSAQAPIVVQRIEALVRRVEAVDIVTAYENVPGYSEQQSTLITQNWFALLIGVLVIGGFFQIQTLQKIPQIGMLKAVGTPNRIVFVATLSQIVLVNLIGVALGAAVTFGLSLTFPPNIPIVITPASFFRAVASILAIGPIGGLVSIRLALTVEPLTALGLSS